MKVGTNKGREKVISRRKICILFAAIAVIALAYGGWYCYCHYYPSIKRKISNSSSADIVKSEFRFGDVNSTHLKAAKKNGIHQDNNSL